MSSAVPALALGGPLGIKGLYPYGSIMKRTTTVGYIVRLCGVPFRHCPRPTQQSFRSRADAYAYLDRMRKEYNAYSVFYWTEGSVLKMVNRKHPDAVMLFDANQACVVMAYHWCPRKCHGGGGGRYYVATTAQGHRTVIAHRVLAGESFHGHANGNLLDNRAANLGLALAPLALPVCKKRAHVLVDDAYFEMPPPPVPPPPLPEFVFS